MRQKEQIKKKNTHDRTMLDELQYPSIFNAEGGVRHAGKLSVTVVVSSDDKRLVGRGNWRNYEALGGRPGGTRTRSWRRWRWTRVFKNGATGVGGVVG
jgi:hypothetical protein